MIGVFDSGVGGLTVVRELKKRIPAEQIIYVGDTARVPWGNKSPQVVQRYSTQICNFFVSKKINKIVIACNTASATSGDFLRKKFKEVEFFDVIEPVVEKVSSVNFSRVAVIGTRATIRSGIYQKRIKSRNKHIKVFSKECPLLVPLVEEGWTNGEVPRSIVRKYLESFAGKNIEAIILGCTHYPLLSATIREVVGNQIKIINCATEVSKAAKSECEANFPKKQKSDEYYFTDANDYYCKLIKKIMRNNLVVRDFPQKYLR